jgi:CHRD domain
MNRLIFLTAFLGLTALPGLARADFVHAKLIGFQEVPSVSTVARGEFRARISKDEQSIQYELTYEGLQGNVTQGHIHIAQRHVNGGIVLWFCGTQPNNPGPAGTPTCTPGSGTFTGTFTAANVQAIAGANAPQQVAAGELAKVIAALRARAAYANVHTDLSPGGEIRGQIRPFDRDRDRDRDKDHDHDKDKDHDHDDHRR